MKGQDDKSLPLFLALCCLLCGGLGLLGVSLWCWTFKDGLGPNAVESHGWVAMTRFWRDAEIQLLPWAALVVAGCALFLWDLRRSA
jgi:hypothetical protein